MSDHSGVDGPGILDAFANEMNALERQISSLRSEENLRTDTALLLQDLESAHEELRVADEEVRAQQAELRRLLESHRMGRWQHERLIAVLPAPVLVTDGRAVIRSANAAAAALLQIRVDRLLNKPLLTFVDSADRAELRRKLSDVATSRSTFRHIATLTGRDRRSSSVELVATVARDAATMSTEVTWVLLGTTGGGEAWVPTGDRAAVATALVELTELPLHKSDRATALNRVADICARALGRDTTVSVSVGPSAEPTLVASTSKVAQNVDGMQITSGQGPCHTAWLDRNRVYTPDLREDDRWPDLSDRVRSLPVRSVLAVPVVVGDELVGVLNAYRSEPSSFHDDEADVVELLATALAAILHEMDLKAELETLAGQLSTALQSRATIDQAKGILMATQACTADEAFARLVEISSRTNVKLREVAAQIVANAASGAPLTAHSRRRRQAAD